MLKFREYVRESYNELVYKVTWPTWSELQGSAIVVSIAAIIIALLVWVMDFTVGISGQAANAVTGEGGSLWRGLLGFFYDIFK